MSVPDEKVLDAAETLSEELAKVQSETDPAEFESILLECSEAISQRTGVDYGSVCDAGGCC